VQRWLVRYREGGAEALDRRRAPGSGRPQKLGGVADDVFLSLVLAPATEFGYETDFWTCRRLVQVLQRQSRIRVSRQTVWRRLRRLGLTYQKPERRYLEASEEERRAWRRYELPKIRRCVREHKALLYFQDEANISLTAVLGKTWAPKGETPTRAVTGKRGGVAAMSAVSKTGRLVFRLLQKRINSRDVIGFLEQLLKHHKRRHVVVVMDRARPHTSKITQAFIASQRRLHVFYLPKYSPDWNPDEKIWHHLKNEELKDHQATSIDELKRTATGKLRSMQRRPDLVRGIFFRCCVADLLD
jgi:transposase